eukprot:14231777-Heterocapsa_arctica.AAC.1
MATSPASAAAVKSLAANVANLVPFCPRAVRPHGRLARAWGGPGRYSWLLLRGGFGPVPAGRRALAGGSSGPTGRRRVRWA